MTRQPRSQIARGVTMAKAKKSVKKKAAPKKAAKRKSAKRK